MNSVVLAPLFWTVTQNWFSPGSMSAFADLISIISRSLSIGGAIAIPYVFPALFPD